MNVSVHSLEQLEQLCASPQASEVTSLEVGSFDAPLPPEIERMRSLRSLSLQRCGARLPDELSELTNLRALHIVEGAQIELPHGLGQCPLRWLVVSDTPIRHLPTGLSGLEVLSLPGCKELRALPDDRYPHLEYLDLSHTALTDMRLLAKTPALKTLSLNGLTVSHWPASGEVPATLRDLVSRDCHFQVPIELPKTLERWLGEGVTTSTVVVQSPSLRADLRRTVGVTAPRAQWLDLAASVGVHRLAGLEHTETLRVDGCHDLVTIERAPRLRRLSAQSCGALTQLLGLPALEELDLRHSEEVDAATLGALPSLRNLKLTASQASALRGQLPPHVHIDVA